MIDLQDCVAQKLAPLGAESGPQAKVVVAKKANKEEEEVNNKEEETDILLLFTKAPPH